MYGNRYVDAEEGTVQHVPVKKGFRLGRPCFAFKANSSAGLYETLQVKHTVCLSVCGLLVLVTARAPFASCCFPSCGLLVVPLLGRHCWTRECTWTSRLTSMPSVSLLALDPRGALHKVCHPPPCLFTMCSLSLITPFPSRSLSQLHPPSRVAACPFDYHPTGKWRPRSCLTH